jgi:hypothetical protein
MTRLLSNFVMFAFCATVWLIVMFVLRAVELGFIPFVLLGTGTGMFVALLPMIRDRFDKRAAVRIISDELKSRRVPIPVVLALSGILAFFGSFAALLPFAPWPRPEFDGSNSPANMDCAVSHDSAPVSNRATYVAQVRLSDCSDQWMGLVQYFVFVRLAVQRNNSSNIVLRYEVVSQDVDPADLYAKNDQPNVHWIDEHTLRISVVNKEYIVDARPSIGGVRIQYNILNARP